MRLALPRIGRLEPNYRHRSRLAARGPCAAPQHVRAPRRLGHRSTTETSLTKVQLYDTTLRDGMQGQGMSLSAAEKVRVVHALDAPRRRLDRGRLPGLQPEGAGAVRAARRRAARAGDDLRLRDDPPPRRRGRRGRPGARARWSACFAPVVTLVGKTWGLHLDVVTKVSPRREPGDDRRVGRLLRRARASGSSTTPSTSSTAGATTAATRSRASRRGRRPAPRT